MIKICLTSIALGTLSLSLSIFIMDGFEKSTKSKLKNVNPEVVIRPLGCYLNFEKIAPILSGFQEIEAFSPSASQYAILQTGPNIDISNVFMINAIDPEHENDVTNLEKFVLDNSSLPKTLPQLLKNSGVIVGKKLAQAHDLYPGSKSKLVFPDKDPNKDDDKISFKEIDIEINGIFSTGIDELDSNLIITSINLLKEASPENESNRITQIGIRPKPNTDIPALIKKLQDRLGTDVYSWQDLYPTLVSVLKLEKYIVFVVLTLLIIIASMNLISLIFMLITQKRRDIAILYILGMNIMHIKAIFIIMSLLITAISTSMGLALALFIGLYLKTYPIELPDVYYVEYLPINIDFSTIILIFVISIIISLLTSLIPTGDLKKNLNISELLRLE